MRLKKSYTFLKNLMEGIFWDFVDSLGVPASSIKSLTTLFRRRDEGMLDVLIRIGEARYMSAAVKFIATILAIGLDIWCPLPHPNEIISVFSAILAATIKTFWPDN